MPSRRSGESFLISGAWRDVRKPCSAPDLAAHGGEGIAEGRVLLAIPSSGYGGQARLGVELCREQGDEGEQAEQTGRRTRNGQVRPLTLALDPEVITHFTEGDLHLPALDEPSDDLERVTGGIGAE